LGLGLGLDGAGGGVVVDGLGPFGGGVLGLLGMVLVFVSETLC